MIDHGLDGYRQDVGMVLKKPASAGFLFSAPLLAGGLTLSPSPKQSALEISSSAFSLSSRKEILACVTPVALLSQR